MSIKYLSAAAVLVLWFLLKDIWWGDPMIYLCFGKNIAQGSYSFNPGVFSSGATSPLS